MNGRIEKLERHAILHREMHVQVDGDLTRRIEMLERQVQPKQSMAEMVEEFYEGAGKEPVDVEDTTNPMADCLTTRLVGATRQLADSEARNVTSMEVFRDELRLEVGQIMKQLADEQQHRHAAETVLDGVILVMADGHDDKRPLVEQAKALVANNTSLARKLSVYEGMCHAMERGVLRNWAKDNGVDPYTPGCNLEILCARRCQELAGEVG